MINKTKIFKKTNKQIEAINLLSSTAKHIMLYGGSRSGKSFIIIYAMIVRALKEKSRHLAVRLHFNHIKISLWYDTIPKVMELCFPELKDKIIYNKQDYYLLFPNGSEIWITGLDEKLRTEKILGNEYSTIFFNESSQIPFSSINIALTRLAQKNKLKKKAYYDENPPQKSHWSYAIFILNKDPDEWTDKDPNQYRCLLMNPEDNLINIDQDYIKDILDNLSPREKERFKYGLFTTGTEGAVYYAFNRDKHLKEFDKPITPVKIGTDFNVNPTTSIIAYYVNDIIYVHDEIFLLNSNTFELADKIFEKVGIAEIFPDSTGASKHSSSTKTDHQILRDKGHIVKYVQNPHIRDRYNCINGLLSHERLFIHPRCVMLIKDLELLSWENKDPMLSHISDALGYLCWGLAPIMAKRLTRTQYYS